MRVEIEFTTEDSAFADGDDTVASLLRRLADRLEGVDEPLYLPLYDINGNCIGGISCH